MALKSLTSAIRTPSTSQKTKIPTNIANPSMKHCLRFWATWDKLIILIGTSGNTQGVKLRSIPPSPAVISNRIIPNPDDTSIAKVQPNLSLIHI